MCIIVLMYYIYHSSISQVVVKNFDFFDFYKFLFVLRMFKARKERLWELSNDAASSGGYSIFHCSSTAYLFRPF